MRLVALTIGACVAFFLGAYSLGHNQALAAATGARSESEAGGSMAACISSTDADAIEGEAEPRECTPNGSWCSSGNACCSGICEACGRADFFCRARSCER